MFVLSMKERKTAESGREVLSWVCQSLIFGAECKKLQPVRAKPNRAIHHERCYPCMFPGFRLLGSCA